MVDPVTYLGKYGYDIWNADVRLTALADAASTEVSGWVNGYLAEVV